jgi:hypothetical protein
MSSEEKPSLAKLLQSAIDARLCDLNVSLPGEVISYDRAKQTAKIQPQIKRKYSDGRTVNLPIINNVPIVFPRSGKRFVHFDLEAGDNVTLLFSQRSLDQWKLKGGIVEANDPRKFNLSDAVAIPGGFPFPKSFTPKGEDGSIELNNSGHSIIMEKTGKMILENSSGKIEMSDDGKFKVTNNTEELLDLLVQLTEILATTTTNTIFGPMQLNDYLDIAVIKLKLESLKG